MLPHAATIEWKQTIIKKHLEACLRSFRKLAYSIADSTRKLQNLKLSAEREFIFDFLNHSKDLLFVSYNI